MSLETSSRPGGTGPALTVITVRYFAGAKAAAGVGSEQLALPEAGTVADAVALLRARHGERMARVLSASSLLLDEVAVRDRDQPLPAGAILDVLPPFAGG
ncbi:MAG TPA: MoaD/ThiS family protein [Pseudonocardia sp.]